MDMLGNAYGSRTVDSGGNVIAPGTPGGSVTPAIGRGNAYTGAYWNANIDKTQYLTDSAIRSTLVSAIDAGILMGPNVLGGSNNLYVVYVEDNVAVQKDQAKDSNKGRYQNSIQDFDAYHTTFGSNVIDPFVGYTYSAEIHYVVVCTPGGRVPRSSLLGGPAPNLRADWLNAEDEMTMTTSHEWAEAVTDPQAWPDSTGAWHGTGWYTGTKGDFLDNEIGDLVGGQTVYLNGYAVQRLADPNQQAMTPVGARAVNPVNFVLDKSGNLYLSSGSGLTQIDSSVASISDQGIDNFGHAMIDFVTTDGFAYEYHEGRGLTWLDWNVQSARAGQGVSYVLYKNGTVSEYKDWGGGGEYGSWSDIDTTGQVTAIDAGTDTNGVNMVTEVRTDWYWNGSYMQPQSDGYEISDSTGWHSIWIAGGFGSLSLSAGQQGNIGILWYGNAIWLNGAAGTEVTQATNVAQFTMGTDQNGGVQFDILSYDGTLSQYSASNGRATLPASQSIGKAHAGVLGYVFSDGSAYAYNTASNSVQFLDSNAAAVA
jgi:hypothetical protein